MRTGILILIVDDEKDFVEVLTGRLEKNGCRVLAASDGEAGLRALESQAPDLIILDINMPGMGGIEFYRRICDKNGVPRYPVLVLTARGELKDLFKDINASGFMSKPFDIAELFKEIDRIMADEYGMPKEVLIIDDDENTFDKVTVAFLKAGYIVYAPSESQISSEAISDNIPDLLVIKMSSRDAPNDAVAGAFLKIAELADVPVVLFSPDMTAADAKWLKAFKIKADKIILSGKPYDILDAAREVLCSKRKRGG